MSNYDKRPNIIRKVLSLKSIESLYFVAIVFLFLSVVNFVLNDGSKEFSEKEIQKNYQITTQR